MTSDLPQAFPGFGALASFRRPRLFPQEQRVFAICRPKVSNSGNDSELEENKETTAIIESRRPSESWLSFLVTAGVRTQNDTPRPRPAQRAWAAVTKTMARVSRAPTVCLALDIVLPQICDGGRAEVGERICLRPGSALKGLA